MKWTYQWLIQHGRTGFSFNEVVEIPEAWIKSKARLLGLSKLVVNGKGQFDVTLDELRLACDVEGTMIVPCAHTNEPVDYPFQTEVELVFTFGTPSDEDTIQVKGNVIECLETLWVMIQMEIPLRVIKPDAPILPSGEHWRVISEDNLHQDEPDDLQGDSVKTRK